MRILIIDDHPFVRVSARLILSVDGSNSIVGEAPDGDKGLELVSQLAPDLVTLDIQMPGIPAEEFVVEALRRQPNLKILVMSTVNEAKLLERLKKLPISGYLLKSDGPENLLNAVRAVGAGISWYSKALVETLRN